MLSSGFMPAHTDLLVIGAGPAGAAAGIAAARAGARVCVVDRAVFPRPKPCGDALSNVAAAVIGELGAGERLERAPRAVVRGAVALFPDGSRLERSYGAEPGYIVPRTTLDDLLRRELERAGAEMVEGVKVRRLIREAGRFRGAEGDRFVRRARVVIAADGSGSLAWHALGLAPPRQTHQGLAVTAYASGVRHDVDAEWSAHYFERFLPTGYGWVFPPVGGLSNVGVYLRSDRYHARSASLRELFQRFVDAHPARFSAMKLEGPLRTWALPLAGMRPPPAAPGLLTAGDAARLIDPLSGEGIWHALASGRIAGELAAASLGTSDGAALARRHRLRVAREVGWPTALRVGITRAVEVVVTRDLYRSAAVRGLFGWGYRGSAFELSKRTAS